MRITLKVSIALITFIIGVVSTTLWFVYRRPQSQLNVSNSSSSNIRPYESEESEEYAVYSTLLKDSFIKSDMKLLVISDRTLYYANPDYLKRTTSEQRIQDMKKNHPSVDEDTIRDFESKHLQSSKLNPNFNLPIKYVLINEAEYNKASGEDAFNVRAFYKKYPDARGLIRLSRVGFNKYKTQALVRIEFVLCPLCSYGEKVLLKKESVEWKIAEHFSGWVT